MGVGVGVGATLGCGVGVGMIVGTGVKEIYQLEGNTARPYATYQTYLRDTAGKTLFVVAKSYLNTYSRGEVIN